MLRTIWLENTQIYKLLFSRFQSLTENAEGARLLGLHEFHSPCAFALFDICFETRLGHIEAGNKALREPGTSLVIVSPTNGIWEFWKR